MLYYKGREGPAEREENKMKNYQKEYELRQANLDAWIIHEFRVALQNAERALEAHDMRNFEFFLGTACEALCMRNEFASSEDIIPQYMIKRYKQLVIIPCLVTEEVIA